MKELSIEEKAKAYDEAVINGSRLWECGKITRENYEYIFPELTESDDERIRKALISFLKSPFVNENITDEKVTPWIAWLEKQGEQKSVKKPRWYDSMDELIADALIEEVGESELRQVEKDNRIYWINKHRQKQEWSEDYIPSREFILNVWELENVWKELTKGSIITEHGTQLDYIQKHWKEGDYYDKIKSLRPQNRWKPSDKEMKALANALSLAKNCGEESAFDLRTLYEQLKNL